MKSNDFHHQMQDRIYTNDVDRYSILFITGIPRVWMQGVRTDIDVEMRAMKYDRYKCKYRAPFPGKLLF